MMYMYFLTSLMFLFHLSPSYRKRTLEEYEQDTMSSRLSLSQRVQTYLYYPPHKRVLRWFGFDRLAGDAVKRPLPGHQSIGIPLKEIVA